MKKYRTSVFGRTPRGSRSGYGVHRSGRRSGKRHERGGPRKNRGVVALLSLVMIFAGLGLFGYSVLGAGSAVAGVIRATVGSVEAPEDTSMRLTVPEMSRVKDAAVYTAAASDTVALDSGAVHVEGTGFPWDAEANVYIAGHRLGYPGTGSFLQFRDLHRLENGDEILIEDANGTTYTYTVFDKKIVAPSDYHVTAPIPGKNIVTLQTCTLPDYSERLIVQGELTSIT